MPEPTITSRALPPSQQPGAQSSSPAVPVVPTQDVLTYEEIEAKPLRSPNFINLVPKNKSLSLYWGNRAVGEKESGMRYDQLIAMGFIPAKPEDILTASGQACPPSLCRDGRIMYGDLILLKMSRADYVGATKWNAESASRRVRKFGTTQATPADGRGGTESALSEVVQRSRGKIQPYIPNLADTDSKTADNSGIPANLAEK